MGEVGEGMEKSFLGRSRHLQPEDSNATAHSALLEQERHVLGKPDLIQIHGIKVSFQ